MTSLVTLVLFVIALATLVGVWRLARRPAGAPNPVLNEQDMQALVDRGFFEHVPEAELETVKAEVARTTWPFWVEGTRRFLLTDAEDLAEGGVSSFVEELRSLLELRAVAPGPVEDLWETDYRVSCGGRELLIWSAEESARERDEDKPGLTWGLATARSFALVNRLLRDAGSRERLYAVGGGNELQAHLLTPELAELVSGFPTTDERERPYLPDEAYPWFGQPHR